VGNPNLPPKDPEIEEKVSVSWDAIQGEWPPYLPFGGIGSEKSLPQFSPVETSIGCPPNHLGLDRYKTYRTSFSLNGFLQMSCQGWCFMLENYIFSIQFSIILLGRIEPTLAFSGGRAF
jgi:hypothetical protein